MKFKMEFIAGSKMQKAIILTIVSNLAIGVVLCAPSNQQTANAAAAAASSSTGSQSAAASQSAAKQSASVSAAAAASAADKPKSTAANQFSSAATSVSGSPSIVNLRSADGGSSGAQRSHAEEMDVFDGKNPFADDSLWQIPIHLVRDLSAGRADEKDDMAKSSSEVSNADGDNDNDDEMAPPASSSSSSISPHGSPSSPTVISASTDLKTAAGYHYPSSHEHHGYGHESAGYHGAGHHDGHHAGHHGGHYGGADHHYGKYFQYASVPYPGAWEFGYRRGNPYHTIERYEHAKGPHFKTKVKWSDKHGGYGVHVWDYNHDDHHSHHYGGDGDHYESHKPAHYGGSDGHHHGGHHHGGHYGYH